MPHSCNPHLLSRHAVPRERICSQSFEFRVHSGSYILKSSPDPLPDLDSSPALCSTSLHGVPIAACSVLTCPPPSSDVPSSGDGGSILPLTQATCHPPNPSANSASSRSKHTKYIQSVTVPTRSCSPPRSPRSLSDCGKKLSPQRTAGQAELMPCVFPGSPL